MNQTQGMNEPVGINCACELLRANASIGSAIEALVNELDLTRSEAELAVRAAHERMSYDGSCRNPDACVLRCRLMARKRTVSADR